MQSGWSDNAKPIETNEKHLFTHTNSIAILTQMKIGIKYSEKLQMYDCILDAAACSV